MGKFDQAFNLGGGNGGESLAKLLDGFSKVAAANDGLGHDPRGTYRSVELSIKNWLDTASAAVCVSPAASTRVPTSASLRALGVHGFQKLFF